MEFRRLGLVPYDDAWALQRQVHAEVVAGADDVVLLLEHPPVFTAGKRTLPHERPLDGTPVVDVDRGGKITWHGPGQVTGYPVVRLADPVDVVAYVRRLEQVLIEVCAEVGLATIGIRVAHGVTMHGFALNCDPDLSAYGAIVPCGIADAGVTSLSAELGRDVTVEEVLPLLERHLPALVAPATV